MAKGRDVSYKTKIQKFKQITTGRISDTPRTEMFPIKQRYKNLSKSQLGNLCSCLGWRCFL